MKKLSKGFTLIELIVVIGIIAVLAGLILVRISDASQDARNSARKSDLSQIIAAVEQYRVNGGDINASEAATPLNPGDLALVEGTGDVFEAVDNNGNWPRNYLAGDTYPTDPNNATTYYTIETDANEVVTVTATATEPASDPDITDSN